MCSRVVQVPLTAGQLRWNTNTWRRTPVSSDSSIGFASQCHDCAGQTQASGLALRGFSYFIRPWNQITGAGLTLLDAPAEATSESRQIPQHPASLWIDFLPGVVLTAHDNSAV